VISLQAEAELLSAIVTFFTRLGITASDVGIKISNRKVLQAVLARYSIPDESFAAVCVIVDKVSAPTLLI
jgi:histidyl-tRNA synthetase